MVNKDIKLPSAKLEAFSKLLRNNRLVAKNTIEEKILKLHSTKRDLADSLLDGTDQSARLSTVDLLNLLKEV